MRATPHHLLINFIAFETGWFAVVLGAAHGFIWAGVSVAVLVVMLHLLLVQGPRHEITLLLVVTLLGTTWDSLLCAQGVIRYSSGQLLLWVAPVWIMAVWALFATTLNVALRFLHGRYWLAALFGAIGAPLSFLAGMRLHALQLPDVWFAVAVLAAGWAILMPVLMYLSQRFDGVRMTEQAA